MKAQNLAAFGRLPETGPAFRTGRGSAGGPCPGRATTCPRCGGRATVEAVVVHRPGLPTVLRFVARCWGWHLVEERLERRCRHQVVEEVPLGEPAPVIAPPPGPRRATRGVTARAQRHLLARPPSDRRCALCGTHLPAGRKHRDRQFCSQTCANRSRRKED